MSEEVGEILYPSTKEVRSIVLFTLFLICTVIQTYRLRVIYVLKSFKFHTFRLTMHMLHAYNYAPPGVQAKKVADSDTEKERRLMIWYFANTVQGTNRS